MAFNHGEMGNGSPEDRDLQTKKLMEQGSKEIDGLMKKGDEEIQSRMEESKNDLATKIADGNYDSRKNDNEIYNSPIGRINVSDQEGAKDMINWLTGNPDTSKSESSSNNHEALDTNAKANEGFKNTAPLSNNGKNFFANENQISEQAGRDALHQEALDSNAKANEGFKNTAPLSQNGKNFFANENQTSEQARRDALHKEALDSNAKANEGFKNTAPLSNNGKNFFANENKESEEGNTYLRPLTQDEIAEVFERAFGRPLSDDEFRTMREKRNGNVSQISEQAGRDALHQEALDSNAKANEGFMNTAPLSNTGKAFFQNEDVYKEKENISELNDTIRSLASQLEAMRRELEYYKSLLTEPRPVVGPTPIVEPAPVIEPRPVVGPTPIVEPRPVINPIEESSSATQIAELRDELRKLRGQDTPEQRASDLDNRIIALVNGRELSALSDQEKIQYFDLDTQRQTLRREIDAATQETERKRTRKERIIKIVSFAAGAGIAIATPAVSVAAVVAVTLGGRFGSWALRKGETALRRKSEVLKYADRSTGSLKELAEIDKKQQRNEWWANRLGEVASVMSGGSAGYGLGKLAQNLFGWKGLGGGTESTAPQPNPNPHQPQTPPSEPQSFPPQGGETGGQEVLNDSPLIKDGRVNLPGSAWDGNLAGGPTGNLPGGELNYSNYPGGIENMAAHMLNKDLAAAGVTPDQLAQLETSEIHRGLLNGYFNAIKSGTLDPNLPDILKQMSSQAAKNLLNTVGK